MNHIGTQTLESRRLILRPFSVEDAGAMYRNWASDPEVTKYLTWPTHTGEAITEGILREWVPHYEEPCYYHWAIVLKDSGEPVGSIAVMSLDERVEKATVGYCLGRAWWHRGFMTEALNLVIDFLFNRVGLQRVEAYHDPRNPHSGAVMRKCGMTYEGTLRASDRNNRGICDACWYAILKE
ncbi:MAG: GNAT family N-acetyltransferase [Clostridia bacterium]|nr:GNAT family N-acetyltransferase [Clostridia bacterium]